MSAKGLNLSTLNFIAEYVKDGNASRSAIAAGYAEKSARSIGYKLLQHPLVQAEIEEARKKIQAQVGYNLETAMREAEEAIQFSRETENANAYVKAVELRSKLNGLLIEKIDVRQSGFQLVIGNQPAPAILTTSRPVEALPAPEQEQEESEDVDIWS